MTVALRTLRMLSVTAAELAALEATVDRHSVDNAAGLRAAIILKCVVEGSENEVSKLMDVKPAQVRKWRQRWEESGMDGLRARRPPRRELLATLDPECVRRVLALRGAVDPATGKRHTIEAIAERVGLSRHVVFKVLQERRRRADALC
jgi:homeodomain-containing protein